MAYLDDLTEETALLLDGLGACVSTLLLGLALPALQEWIGMPTRVLYLLAGIAALLALSGFSGYRFAGDHAPRWLRATVVANLLYCGLTATLMVLYRAELTGLGMVYFAAEIAVILALVSVERRILRPSGAPGEWS